MIKPSGFKLVPMVVVLALAVVEHGVAQGNGDEQARSARTRNECRLAAQIIETGHPHTRRIWALQRLPSCPGEGAVALSGAWVSLRDSSEIEDLMRGSMRLRDGRVYSQVLAAAGDPIRLPAMRVAAMLVLAKYVNPANGVSRRQLVPPDTFRFIRAALGSTTDRSYFHGAVPLPSGYGREVLTLLERLAASRSSEPIEVWYAAEMLRQRVEFDLPRAQ